MGYRVPSFFFLSFWLYYEINTRHCLVSLWSLNKVSLMDIFIRDSFMFLSKFSFFPLAVLLGCWKKKVWALEDFMSSQEKDLNVNKRKFVRFEFWLQKDNFDIVGGQSSWSWAVISCVKTGFQKWFMRTFRHAEGSNLKFWWILFSNVQWFFDKKKA